MRERKFVHNKELSMKGKKHRDIEIPNIDHNGKKVRRRKKKKAKQSEAPIRRKCKEREREISAH